MTVDTTARAEVILEEPEEDEAFGKDNDEEDDDEDDSEGEFKKEKITSFEERMLAANPEVIMEESSLFCISIMLYGKIMLYTPGNCPDTTSTL